MIGRGRPNSLLFAHLPAKSSEAQGLTLTFLHSRQTEPGSRNLIGMSTALSTLSKNEALDRLRNARNRLASVRDEARAVAQRGTGVVLGAAAGYGVGLAHHHYGNADGQLLIPGTSVPADIAVGVLAAGIGVSGYMKEQSDALCSIASGTLGGAGAILALRHARLSGAAAGAAAARASY